MLRTSFNSSSYIIFTFVTVAAFSLCIAAAAVETGYENVAVENSPLIRLLAAVEAGEDEDGRAVAQLCNLHVALENIASAIMDTLNRKAGGMNTCVQINPLRRALMHMAQDTDRRRRR